MDPGTEEQQLWRETARRFLETEAPVGHARSLIGDDHGYDRSLYRRMADLGWMAPMAPESSGGGSLSGRPFADLAVVAEEMGRTLTPGPVVEANLALLALRLMAVPAPKALIESLTAGRATVTVALAGSAGDGWNAEGEGLTAEATPKGWNLSGVRAAVPFGHSVDTILTTARSFDGAVRLFLVPSRTPGLGCVRLESLDLTRPLARLEFDEVELDAQAALSPSPADTTTLGAWLAATVVLQAAETIGALAWVMEVSVEYAQQRRAFGRAIGSFQAVKHRLADMALWLEWARAASALAVESADEWMRGGSHHALMEAASVAKVVQGEYGPALVRSAVQVHGGIGYTWEHDVHLYLRRVEANAALLGTTDFHRDLLARRIGFPEAVSP